MITFFTCISFGNLLEKMKQPLYSEAIRQFFKTTTLHGFKYLISKYYYDRVGWLICCCASACCAGLLCAVLWARFLQVPALLTLRDLRSQYDSVHMPLVAVCPPAETIANYFKSNLIINSSAADHLETILGLVLRRKVASKDHLFILEDILYRNNLSLPEALMTVMPPCHSIALKCRWQSTMVPCGKLFDKELTEWGPCCTSRPENLLKGKDIVSQLEVKRRLSIAVQCSNESTINGCEFFTKYNHEEWIEPVTLTAGHNYIAQMTFTSVVDSDPEKLVDGTCVSIDGYSRNLCMLTCREYFCGCSDPLKFRNINERSALPPCVATQLNCLRSFNFDNSSCKCLPSCKKVTTDMALESSYMNAFNEVADKIYHGLNVTTSSVLFIAVGISGSRIFVVNPTETWITLLSSLGGVFNMFLGVGLFSALEILFLVFVRLPIAIRKSTEMENQSVVMHLWRFHY